MRPLGRREFVVAGAAGVAGLLGLPVRDARGRVVPDNGIGPLGVQLYTLRELASNDLSRAISEVARAGYKEIEFAGYFRHSAAAVRKMLDDAGVVSPSSHIALSDVRTKWDETLGDANTLGQTQLVVPWIDEQERTPDGFRRLADLFNRAGSRARDAGIHLTYHNQAYDFTPVGGSTGYQILLDATAPQNLLMQMDVFWLRAGGQDPARWLAGHSGRFVSLHLKDMGPPPENRMVDVGSGVIDWAAIIPVAKRSGVKHFFVEHDQPRDAVESIRSSYRYLSRLRLPE